MPVLPAILLMGPTAAGKSALALALARDLDVEIVSVDSAQVFRGLDVGTAKPDAATRAAVPHHLVDVIDPDQAYSAARFRTDALAAVAAIRARGRLPLLVGGTMLYFKALTEGLSALPPADPAVRAALDRRAAASGWPALHAELARVDPATAARLAPNDAQRIQRALEVHALTGRPLSALQGARQADDALGPTLALALLPADRAALHAAIAERFATCWPWASSTSCGRSGSATRSRPGCLRCAASAIARRGSSSTGPSTPRACARPASRRRASSRAGN